MENRRLKNGELVYILNVDEDIINYAKKAVVVDALYKIDNASTLPYLIRDEYGEVHTLSYPESFELDFVVTRDEYIVLLNSYKNTLKKEIEKLENQIKIADYKVEAVTRDCGTEDTPHIYDEWKEASWAGGRNGTGPFILAARRGEKGIGYELEQTHGWQRSCKVCGHVERVVDMPEELKNKTK